MRRIFYMLLSLLCFSLTACTVYDETEQQPQHQGENGLSPWQGRFAIELTGNGTQPLTTTLLVTGNNLRSTAGRQWPRRDHLSTYGQLRYHRILRSDAERRSGRAQMGGCLSEEDGAMERRCNAQRGFLSIHRNQTDSLKGEWNWKKASWTESGGATAGPCDSCMTVAPHEPWPSVTAM